MPTILLLFGLRFYFYSEEHLPIHIHVSNGTGKAKILVEPVQVIENKGLKPQELRKACDAVLQYRDEIIKAWREYFDE
jgi:hypothetical protein